MKSVAENLVAESPAHSNYMVIHAISWWLEAHTIPFGFEGQPRDIFIGHRESFPGVFILDDSSGFIFAGPYAALWAMRYAIEYGWSLFLSPLGDCPYATVYSPDDFLWEETISLLYCHDCKLFKLAACKNDQKCSGCGKQATELPDPALLVSYAMELGKLYNEPPQTGEPQLVVYKGDRK